VDKIEFFGNFPRNVFCAFAVTLLARPKKRHVGDHVCFASPFCDEQVIVGRKVDLIVFFGKSSLPISHQVTLPCSIAHPHARITCAGCHYQRDVKRGRRRCYTPDFLPDWLDHHHFPTFLRKGKNPPQHLSPAATLLPESPRDANIPWSAASRVRDGDLPSNSENDANQLISKNSKISFVSHESVVLCYQNAGPGNKKSSTSLVGPSPAPGL